MANKKSLTSIDLSAGIADWQTKMRAAAFDAISESDVKEIVENMVASAKKGDAKALQMVFDLFLGGKQGPATAAALTQNNLIIQDATPTRALPGTRDKLSVLSERAANGIELSHDRDRRRRLD